MLQLFKNNDLFANIFVIIYFIFFAIGTWIHPLPHSNIFANSPATLLYLINDLLANPVFNKIAFSLLVLAQAFYLNYIIGSYKVVRQKSMIPAVCFILLHFAIPQSDYCNPVIIANTFLLFSFHSILASYDKKASLGTIFNIGFWIAVASFFYHSHLVYIIWAMLALLLIRTFNPQEFTIMLLGFFTPFFLATTSWFAFDGLAWWWVDVLMIHSAGGLFRVELSNSFWLGLFILFSPYLLSLINLNSLLFKTTSKEKKYIHALLFMPLMGAFTFFFQNEIHGYHFGTFLIPIGILLGLLSLSLKNRLGAEIFHLILFMTCLGLQYQSFFFN